MDEMKTNESIDDIVEISYLPECTNIVDCPTCSKEFDVLDAYTKDNKCPHCGQLFKVNIWIS